MRSTEISASVLLSLFQQPIFFWGGGPYIVMTYRRLNVACESMMSVPVGTNGRLEIGSIYIYQWVRRQVTLNELNEVPVTIDVCI